MKPTKVEIYKINVLGILGIVFVSLKLTGYITWSWWYVTLPFWIIPATVLIISFIALIIFLFNNK
jgi:hypothetical protein